MPASGRSCSEYFLLLASPGSARSEWVPREVEHWLGLGRASKLLVALTDGEIVWDADRNGFDWESTTALPRVMEGVLQEPPLFVDFRWAKQQRNEARRQQNIATARQLAAEAEVTRNRDPRLLPLSALLAVESLRAEAGSPPELNGAR